MEGDWAPCQDTGFRDLVVLRLAALDVVREEGAQESLRGVFERGAWNGVALVGLLAHD